MARVPALRLMVLLFGCLLSPVVAAEGRVAARSQEAMAHGADHSATMPRLVGRSWVLNIDNDLFVAGGLDRDYTGGISLTIGHPFENAHRRPGQRVLDRLERWSGLAGHQQRVGAGEPVGRALQFGVLALTPEFSDSALPEPGDRPYASMAYVTESRFRVNDAQTLAYQSSITLALIGSSLAEQLQRKLHSALGLRVPAGYERQISNGGELSAQYAVARRSLLQAHGDKLSGHDLRLSLEGNIGFTTEGVAGVLFRWGRRTSPWWSDPSGYGEFASRPVSKGRSSGNGDFFLALGVQVRARLYNVLVHGQFRATESALSIADTRPFVADAWLGVVRSIGALRVSYTIRYQTPELRRGIGSRDQIWASIALERTVG